MTKRQTGFTLIELMVVMVVLGIIVSLGVGSYRQYVQRANRVDATAALLRLTANQERFYLQNNIYASNAQLAAALPAGLGLAGTDHGYYNLAIVPAAGGLIVGYTASATVVVGESQGSDTDCWTFTVNEQSLHTGNTQGGGDNTAVCWQ